MVAGGPYDGIMDLGDELIFIGDSYVKGMPLQDVSTLLSKNQEEEIVFIVHKGNLNPLIGVHTAALFLKANRRGQWLFHIHGGSRTRKIPRRDADRKVVLPTASVVAARQQRRHPPI